ncbi:hypothetical protein [Candidatus Uabimicrobium sp. HlEnr_7]|uniref:hypothetical protein n=1 Tax=Candidatus Uabimicrobium helgolandensis TaxID=3095367 RepID=UPI00355601EF
MNKLSEKQINLVIVGAGVLVAIIFFTMRHFDQNEIERLKVEKQNVDSQTLQLKNKERQIETKKQELYLMRANTDAVKRLLPQDKKVTEFFELMEQFRVQNEIQAFEKVKKVASFFEINDDKEDSAGQAAVQQPVRRIVAPTASNPFVEDAYHVEFQGSFNDLGELISKVESHERFFSVKELKIEFADGKLEVDQNEKEMTGKVQLVVTTFTFENPDQTLDEKLARILDKYEPSTLLKQKVSERREELLKRYVYQWGTFELIRDPFYPFRAIEVVPEPVEGGGEIDGGPIDVSEGEELTEAYNKVNNLYNDILNPLSLEGDWIKLHQTLEENNFEINLKRLNLATFPGDFDPDGQKHKKLTKIAEDLGVWKTYIDERIEDAKIKQLIATISDNVKAVAVVYKKARKKGDSVELLQEVVKRHQKLMPDLLEHRDKENQYKILATARKKLEFYYKKAKIQLELIDKVKKLELTGVIYQPSKNRPSVAFINKKPVRVKNLLSSGFVVKKINNGWVVLDYKGETVPLRMKSLGKQN